jgi:hypothetical protein
MPGQGHNLFARQHYEAIAAVMQSARDHNWQAICEKLADMLKADNSGVRDLGSRQMTPLRGSTGNAFLFSQIGQTCPIADPVEYEQADR